MKRMHAAVFRMTAWLLAALMGLGTLSVLPAQAAETDVSFKRKALELVVGETDRLVPVVTGSSSATCTFESSNPTVVTVDKDGNLTAKKLGQATITAKLQGTNLKATCRVEVIEKEHTFDDQIMITMFWPPTADYINDEQFKLLADAGITQVMGAGPDQGSVEIQGKMLELCAKYGMGLTIEDGSGWNFQSEERIAELISRYHNVPAAYGYYLADEPMSANGFVSTYVGIKKQEPNAYIHLNFLPQHVYGSSAVYKAQMTDYARLCDEAGYPLDYLMFDMYPFGPTASSMEQATFFSNLRSVYEVGLKNDVKTGLYIQTVCIPGALRRPAASEIRYEMYSALAFGYKQLSFFTWFTPVNRGEPFDDGIISPTGVPNAHYYDIKQINSEIHAIGGILAKCDALGVYFTGRKTYNQPAVPEDFFAQNGHGSDNFILSWMRHRETGRNYLMVVNNNYNRKQSMELIFDDAIKSLAEVSRTDGSLQPLSMDGQTLIVELAAGDAMFIALPEDFDFYKAPEGQPAASVNLARDAVINASSSVGGDGYYIYNLNDGTRYVAGTSGEQAWRSVGNGDAHITLDLGRKLEFNRMDLYPAGNLFSFGENFPVNVEISVSDDGKSWKSVKAVTGLSVTEVKAVQIDIEKQSARYVRLDMKDIPAAQPWVALNEVEVYNDDGSVMAPGELNLFGEDKVITYKEGENIAKGKTPFASSSAPANYAVWGWSLDYINDGHVDENGTVRAWTSNIGRNYDPNSTEYVGVDFGDLFAVDKVVIRPFGAFPENYHVELSEDGRNWTVISKVEGANPTGDIEITLDTPVNARFVRMVGTRLRMGGAASDGYLFQLGDIEAYGKPVCDKAVLETAMEIYRTEGGDTSAADYTASSEALANALLTQSKAKDLAKKLYLAVGYLADGTKPAPETEPVTDPVVTEPVEPVTEESTPIETPAMTDPEASETTVLADTLPAQARGCGSSLVTGVIPLALAGFACVLTGVRRRRR